MAAFLDYEPNQPFLFPPDIRARLRIGHPAYHPVMLVKLLIYGYSIGVTASRKIEDATWLDVAFRVLVANQHPDHDTRSRLSGSGTA